MTSDEQRENVATAVLFISGEDDRMKRATLVKQALRPLRPYIVEWLSFFSSQQAFQFVYVALKKRNSLFKVTTVRLLLTTSSTTVLFTCAPRPSIH